MMKKKIVTLALAGAVAFSLMACSGQTATSAGSTVSASSQTASSETPESITISSYNGSKELVELEVPYDPQRIAILDMASLDILDAPGRG